MATPAIAPNVAFSVASTVSNLANKAFQHSARAKRAAGQRTDAATIGVSYECVRQFDAGIGAGLKSFAPCQGGADTRCKTAAGADCDFTKVAANRGIATAAVNANNNGTTPDPAFRALNPGDPTTGKIVQSVTGTTPNTVTKQNPFGSGGTPQIMQAGLGGSTLGIVAAVIGAIILMFAAFSMRGHR